MNSALEKVDYSDWSFKGISSSRHMLIFWFWAKLDLMEGLPNIIVLQTQVLRVGQVNESCIRLTQENLIESSIQTSLSYIPN